jgi:hypothetical protein
MSEDVYQLTYSNDDSEGEIMLNNMRQTTEQQSNHNLVFQQIQRMLTPLSNLTLSEGQKNNVFAEEEK